MKKYLLIIFSVIFIAGCILEIGNGDGGNSIQQDEEAIRNVILDIFYDFNYDDIFGIMDHFDADFLHYDVDFYDEQQVWYNRFDQWNTALVYNISPNIMSVDYAKVGFTLEMDGQIFNVNSLSGNFSDVTILKKSNGVWKIYGNQNSGWEHYEIEVNSQPSGARIYIDGEYTEEVTPHTITNIPEGQYDVGVYLRDYNEIAETIYIDENEYLNFNLSLPSYPTPEFYLTSPENGEVFYENYFTLSGYIQLFEGNMAILTYNDVEYNIPVDNMSDFNIEVPISQYENTFFIRATNIQGNTGTTEDYTVYHGDNPPVEELTINLTWNTDSTDVDLHIWDPDGNWCYWQFPDGIPNGFLEDDMSGYGPETFNQSPVTEGAWVVKAVFYEGYNPENPTSAEIEIIVDEEVVYNFGPYEFSGEGDEWEMGFTVGGDE
ncbi:MAG: PEGA domain-containing protein [Candidatus Cloacimonadota bacterium]|nr:PEGA domain-containing protein [Candidatus Cloacimonadota bacterium]